MLSAADHDRISEAVKAAEARTSGEILCVLSHKVSNYRETPLAWAIAVAMIAPPVGLLFGLHPWLISRAGGDWVATNAVSLDASVNLALSGYTILQLLLFLATTLLIAFVPSLKLALTPKSLKRRRVRQAALFQLRAAHLLGSGSGVVVIFASEAERMVTVVADEAIHLKAGDAAWDQAVAAVLKGIKTGDAASGFVAAIEICGGYLAEHFPSDGTAHNALSDRLVEF
jgi:putative membrane protein